MPAATDRPKHDATVSIRVPQRTKELIDSAARSAGKTFSAFVIESASRHATEMLLDRTVFDLGAEEAEAFARVLDDPPPPPAALRALMESRSPWEG